MFRLGHPRLSAESEAAALTAREAPIRRRRQGQSRMRPRDDLCEFVAAAVWPQLSVVPHRQLGCYRASALRDAVRSVGYADATIVFR